MQRRAGLGVYVHCDAGVSRSPMVVAAYLMWRDHLTRDQSLQLIRDKRPIIYPNNAFMGLLLDWQQSLGPAIR